MEKRPLFEVFLIETEKHRKRLKERLDLYADKVKSGEIPRSTIVKIKKDEEI